MPPVWWRAEDFGLSLEAAGPARRGDQPGAVHTLILPELSLLSVPASEAFFHQAGPAFEAYGNGDHEEALAISSTSNAPSR